MSDTTRLPELVYPVVTGEFETFDFSKLDRQKGFSVFKLPDGIMEEYQSQSDGYITRIQRPDSYFTLIKKFYVNGNIESKGLIFNSGDFEQGNWYYFDPTGKKVREEDNNAGYKFKFEQVFVYLRHENIPLTIGQVTSGFRTKVMKDTEAGNPQWIIRWLKDASRLPNIVEIIVLDGNSGKVIKKIERKYNNN